MLVLITYDVETITPEGKRRLRNVAKQCMNFGQRVQNSVFECNIDTTQLAELRNRLQKIINLEKDSLRFYNLGNSWRRKVEHMGTKPSFDPESTLIV
jgi:CRISPR-associated protein Cas2